MSHITIYSIITTLIFITNPTTADNHPIIGCPQENNKQERSIPHEPPKSEINRTCGCPHENKKHDRSVPYAPPRRMPPKPPKPSPLKPTARSEPTPEELEERINRGFARMMQFFTLLGHVDNYLTDKASDFIKIMGKAIETAEEDPDYPEDEYNGIARRSPRTKSFF